MRQVKLHHDPRFLLASQSAKLLALLIQPHLESGSIQAVPSTSVAQTAAVITRMPLQDVAAALGEGERVGLFALEGDVLTVAPSRVRNVRVSPGHAENGDCQGPLSAAERARRYRRSKRDAGRDERDDRHENRHEVRDDRHEASREPSRTVTENVTITVTPSVTETLPTGAHGIARAEDFSKKEEKKEENPQTPFAVTTDRHEVRHGERHENRHDEPSRTVTTETNVTESEDPPEGSPPTAQAPSVLWSSSLPQESSEAPAPNWDEVEKDVGLEEPEREAQELFPPTPYEFPELRRFQTMTPAEPKPEAPPPAKPAALSQEEKARIFRERMDEARAALEASGTPAPAEKKAPAEPAPAKKVAEPKSSETLRLLPAESEKEKLSPERQVFEHWKRVMGHVRAGFAGSRETKVKARLNEGYTVQDLCIAIDGYRSSAFHMGENDRGTPYNDLAFICRDGAKVDQGLALAKTNKVHEKKSEERELTIPEKNELARKYCQSMWPVWDAQRKRQEEEQARIRKAREEWEAQKQLKARGAA